MCRPFKIFINIFSLLAINFIFSLLCISCNHKSDKDEAFKNKITQPVQQFENNTWTFKKNVVADTATGIIDTLIDKTLVFYGDITETDCNYDVSIDFDFLSGVIPTNELPLVFQTTSPNGHDSQSREILIKTNDKPAVIGNESGSTIKRVTKMLYKNKSFREKGKWKFTVYSRYSKFSLPGVKSLAVNVVKSKSNEQ